MGLINGNPAFALLRRTPSHIPSIIRCCCYCGNASQARDALWLQGCRTLTQGSWVEEMGGAGRQKHFTDWLLFALSVPLICVIGILTGRTFCTLLAASYPVYTGSNLSAGERCLMCFYCCLCVQVCLCASGILQLGLGKWLRNSANHLSEDFSRSKLLLIFIVKPWEENRYLF